MENLFSIFDPVSSVFTLHLNWVSVLILVFLLPSSFWPLSSLIRSSFILLTTFLHQEVSLAMGNNLLPGTTHFLISLFAFILINNSMGLLPYIFTASSHLVFSIGLALSSWLGYFVWTLIASPASVLSHLTPLGTPYALMPFMVLIELVSGVIRPLTLSVRLAANMVAGHLLLTLIGTPASSLPLFGVLLLLSGMILLMILESAVAVIQAYVFMTLSSLYITETNNASL